MRDLLFILIMLPLLAAAVARPFVGIMLWSWISFMNPHQLVWGIASQIPWAALSFVATVAGCVFAREPRRFRIDTQMTLLLLLAAGVTVTSLVGIGSAALLWPKYDRVIKVLLGLLLTALLLDERRRLHALLWLIAISLGYFGVKGGLFTLMTGGGFKVLGPPNSMISDRNQLAVALLVSAPIMNYLRLQSRHVVVRNGLLAAMVLTMVAAIGTQSRGALVAFVATIAVFWFRSRGKVVSGVLLAVVATAILAFMPESWEARMETIMDPTGEQSANARLRTWGVIWQLVMMRPLLGVGFRGFYQSDIVALVAPGVPGRAAHSIWFEVLGEHGFIVFAIWLGLFVTAFRQTIRLQRLGRHRPDLLWAADLGRMVQVSMIAFLTGGSFVSLGYWDCMLTLLVIVSAAQRLALGARDRVADAAPEVPGWRARAALPVAAAAMPPRGAASR